MMNDKNGGKKMTNTALDFSQFEDMFAGIEEPKVSDAGGNNVEVNPISYSNEESIDVNGEKVSITNVGVGSDYEKNLLASAVEKMKKIASEMKDIFVERDDLINIMELALVTNTNLLMLGPPGTGKSYITYDLCKRIDGANYFQWMLNKTSDPSEILGSFSVKQMENDHFTRITTGKLPEAHIAFLDEVYKSNAPTLNALLTIMNEHIFYNDGKAIDVPLISMFGASNEPPEDDSLMALHDRFVFRINLEYVHDARGRKKMHNNYLLNRANKSITKTNTKITLEELKALNNAAANVRVSKDIVNKFISFVSDIGRTFAINVSDRRLNECLKILQGSAALNGRDEVILEDFRSLSYVLWEKNDDVDLIKNEIEKAVNPFDDKFNEIKESFNQIKEQIENAGSENEKRAMAVQSKRSINRIVEKTNKLIREASKNHKDVFEFEKFRDDVIKYNTDLINNMFNLMFDEEGADNSNDQNQENDAKTEEELGF